MKDGKETGVGQGAQRGETQELPVHGTPRYGKTKSKLGRGLDMETLMVPQGFSSSLTGAKRHRSNPGIAQVHVASLDRGNRGYK